MKGVTKSNKPMLQIGEWRPFADWIYSYEDRINKNNDKRLEVIEEQRIIIETLNYRLDKLERVVSAILQKDNLYAKQGPTEGKYELDNNDIHLFERSTNRRTRNNE